MGVLRVRWVGDEGARLVFFACFESIFVVGFALWLITSLTSHHSALSLFPLPSPSIPLHPSIPLFADYRMDGKEEVIAISTDGEVRGYLPANDEFQVGGQTKEGKINYTTKFAPSIR